MEDTSKTLLSQVESPLDLTKREVMRLLGRCGTWVESRAKELGIYWVVGPKLKPYPMFRHGMVEGYIAQARGERKQIIAERVGRAHEQGDFTRSEVMAMLRRSHNWLKDHGDELGMYKVPGRGRGGFEIRYRREMVLTYINRIRDGFSNGTGEKHETVDQIIKKVKAERAAAGQTA